MTRIAVRYKNRILMPMKSKRATRFLETKEAKLRYDSQLRIHYLQLQREPSGYAVQEIVIGIDPGSTFDGISVVSKDTHHHNFELIQRPKKGKNSIKSFKARQALNRRIRRSRLWHRKIRFDNRTKNKLVPTIKANIDFRKWIITKISSLYPISNIVIEDVKFNHAKDIKGIKGRAFSLVELGKIEMYNWIREFGIKLELFQGFNTKKLRINSFGYDPKSMLKDSKDFYAHCIDSFVLACNKTFIVNKNTGEILTSEPIITNPIFVNRKVLYIEKIVKIRRCLTRLRHCYKDRKFYYKKLKGGVKQIYFNISKKPNICRVKLNNEHSNHPKQWEYINNGFVERFKCSTARYGGTTYQGKSYFKDGYWNNRTLMIN